MLWLFETWWDHFHCFWRHSHEKLTSFIIYIISISLSIKHIRYSNNRHSKCWLIFNIRNIAWFVPTIATCWPTLLARCVPSLSYTRNTEKKWYKLSQTVVLLGKLCGLTPLPLLLPYTYIYIHIHILEYTQ